MPDVGGILRARVVLDVEAHVEVHALVAAVVLGVSGTAADEACSQGDPPG
jgi:hypothetical protein